MPTFKDAYTRHQQPRWLKHDAARWVRPDAARFLKPGTRLEDAFPALALKYNPSQPRVSAGSGRESGRWIAGKTSDADPDESNSGEQYAQVIRVCIASGISRSRDQFGNMSYTVTYDCAGGRSITRSGTGSRIRGIILDPFR